MKRFWLILVAMLGLAMSVAPASADMVYTLTKGGTDFATPGNYGTVTLHQNTNGTTGKTDDYVTVTVKLAANYYFDNGSGYAIAWNLKGNPTLTNVSSSKKGITINTSGTDNSSRFAVQSYSSGQQYYSSPFTDGSLPQFMYAIDYTADGKKDNDLVFDVYNKNVGVQVSDFLINSRNFMFAVNIWSDINDCGPTGNVAAVPEPGTSLLFLAVLIGLPMVYRRRKLARV
jgi:hypothetical protein